MATRRKRRRKHQAPCLTPAQRRKLRRRHQKLPKGARACPPPTRRRQPAPPVQPTGTHPAPSQPAAPAPAPGAPPPPAPAPAPPAATGLRSPIAVYAGPWGPRQAERLLWRAGFGPRPGDVERVVALGLEGAVLALTRPAGVAPMTGPEPTVDGAPLSAYDTWYGDHLWWFDRMVRSGHQLVERLALVFHDWWATSNDAVGSNALMLAQTNLFRIHGLGSFAAMAHAVTQDPAMLVFLNGIDNRRGKVNENYARELMELFTLGADRGAYTEGDVRELARALTGFRADWTSGVGLHDFRWDATRWDAGTKTVFGRSGAFTWEDACRLVVEHPLHASFFVRKLWSAFIPVPPSPSVQAALERSYVQGGWAIRPVLEAILAAPELYEGPRMVKPPVVHAAGLLRALEVPITSEAWVWLADAMGQRLYHPPDVSGWDDTRWMDSNTARARWDLVNYVVEGRTLRPDSGAAAAYPAESPEEAVARARAFWLDPALADDTVTALLDLARAFQPPADTTSTPAWQREDRARRRCERQTALRHLIAASPDLQTC